MTSSADFLIYIWARNIETSLGGPEVTTPPSQFRGLGCTGVFDAIALELPAQTGIDLGCIGARGGEIVTVTNAFGARILRPIQPPSAGRIIAVPEVGGLHHRYERHAA